MSHYALSASPFARCSLDFNQLGPQGAAELAKVLPECKALVSVRYAAVSCSICKRKCDSGPCHTSLCCHSVDGHPLPIDELKGIKPVESIDLSGKELRVASAIIIGACIAGNAHLRELKCAQLFKLGGSVTAGGPDLRACVIVGSITL